MQAPHYWRGKEGTLLVILPLVLGSNAYLWETFQLGHIRQTCVDKNTLCSRHKWLAVAKDNCRGYACAPSVYHADVGIVRASFVLEEVSVMARVLAGARGTSELTGRQDRAALLCWIALELAWPWVISGFASVQTLGLDDLPQSLLRSLLSCHLWVYKFILSILLWPLVKSSFLWLQVGKEDVENRAQCSFLEDKPLISSVHSPFLLFVFLTYATTFPSIWGLPSPHFMQYSGTISSLCLSCPPPRLALSRPPPSTLAESLGHFHPVVMEDWTWFLSASISTVSCRVIGGSPCAQREECLFS